MELLSRLKWIWRKPKESRPKAAFTSAIAVRLYAERDATATAQPQPDAAEADEHHRPSRQLGHAAGHAAAAGLKLTVDGDAEELARTGADRSEHGAGREIDIVELAAGETAGPEALLVGIEVERKHSVVIEIIGLDDGAAGIEQKGALGVGDEHVAIREDAQRKGVTARQSTGEIRKLPADRVEAQDRVALRGVVECRLVGVEIDPVGAAALDRHRNIGTADGMDIVLRGVADIARAVLREQDRFRGGIAGRHRALEDAVRIEFRHRAGREIGDVEIAGLVRRRAGGEAAEASVQG